MEILFRESRPIANLSNAKHKQHVMSLQRQTAQLAVFLKKRMTKKDVFIIIAGKLSAVKFQSQAAAKMKNCRFIMIIQDV